MSQGEYDNDYVSPGPKRIETIHGAVPMTWTTDKPTVPGWYWWRFDTHLFGLKQQVVEVYLDEALVVKIDNERHKIDEMNGDWSSAPLEPPKEDA